MALADWAVLSRWEHPRCMGTLRGTILLSWSAFYPTKLHMPGKTFPFPILKHIFSLHYCIQLERFLFPFVYTEIFSSTVGLWKIIKYPSSDVCGWDQKPGSKIACTSPKAGHIMQRFRDRGSDHSCVFHLWGLWPCSGLNCFTAELIIYLNSVSAPSLLVSWFKSSRCDKVPTSAGVVVTGKTSQNISLRK